MQGTFEQEPDKRARLDAMANVPWTNLEPSNDKATQRQMGRHHAMERVYQSSSEAHKAMMPKVTPYPETPDGVFPGCPCYRLVVEGVTRLVFVVDQGSPDFPAGWDGACRAQSGARWIVPHFIFRREEDVTRAKRRYKAVFDVNAGAAAAPPDRWDFNSTALPAPAAGDPPLGALDAHDSYYVHGVPNTDPTAPAISDPLFEAGFNPRAGAPPPVGHVPPIMVRPWPYKQPASIFPRQPPPPPMFHAVPAPPPPPVAGAAPPPPPGAAPMVMVQVLPHADLLTALPPTHTGRNGADWVVPDPGNFEVGTTVLQDICQRAEELDYSFALNMQGLRGTNIKAVWDCTDPEYDVTDRSALLGQFVKMYMEKFYGQVSITGPADVEEVVQEAFRMHGEFCRGWVAAHHRTLSAEVTAASEALVGNFFENLRPYLPKGLPVSRRHLACYMRRHSTYSSEFAQCLYHFMTSLDHSRGNRNPSYKAMGKEQAMYVTAMKNMSELLHSNLVQIKEEFARFGRASLLFDVMFVDWHYIAAQMPQHHKDFDSFSNSFNLFRTRAGGRANAFPPWQQMRMRF